MNSESNSSQSSYKNDEMMDLDMSPVSENKVTKEAVWYVYNKKANVSNTAQPIPGKKAVKSSEVPSKRWGQSSVVYNKSMVIFGGRHSTRSLANIFSFDFTSCAWSKIEPLGQIPPARDSHSAIVVNIFVDFS